MIHPTAVIDSKAKIGSNVEIGPFCVIEGDVQIGSGCRLLHGAHITGWTTIGADCEIHPHAVIGHAPQDIKYHGERSYCTIGKGCIIREYASIHRGTIPDSATVVGDGCFLLAGSHIGHNCQVGNKVTLINNVLLAGHVVVEDLVTIGGATAVHQFVRIGELSMVGGLGRVSMDVPPFALTDPLGRVAGLNRIGLRRNEYPPEELAALRDAYRVLYDGSCGFRDAVQNLATRRSTPATRKLLQFLQRPSKRGITGRSRTRPGAGNAASDSEG